MAKQHDGNLYLPEPEKAKPWVISSSIEMSEGDYFKIFQMLDINHVGNFSLANGDLSKDEIAKVLKLNGLTVRQVDQFFGLFEADVVDFATFCDVMRKCFAARLNFFERVYLTFEDPTSSSLANFISVWLLVLIILSTLCFVIESLPNIRTQLPDCDGVNITCEPYIYSWVSYTLMTVEVICVLNFSLEYFARLCSVPFVREFSIENDMSKYVYPEFDFDMDVYGHRRRRIVKKAERSVYRRIWKFFWKPMNLIDLIAIVPFYAEHIIKADSSDGLMVLRMLRLGRVLRVFKLGRRTAGLRIFANAFASSSNVIFVLCIAISMLCVLCGTLLHLFEAGEWHDPTDNCKDPESGANILCGHMYPNGAYLRPDVMGYYQEESPYSSIVSASWCIMATISTVGYGDLYPTSPMGKVVASISMVIGLLILALPITVIGGAFAREVRAHEIRKEMRRQKNHEDYKAHLQNQLKLCEKEGSRLHSQISLKLSMYAVHERSSPMLPLPNKKASQNDGGLSFYMLTVAKRMDQMDKENKALLRAIGDKCGVAEPPPRSPLPLAPGAPISKRSATTVQGIVVRTNTSSPLHATRSLGTRSDNTAYIEPQSPNQESISPPLSPGSVAERVESRILI